jgi:hypothetical protein
MAEQYDRFRSFAERYIVARAGKFRVGFEREDAWQATLDAKSIYGNVARMAHDAEPPLATVGASVVMQVGGQTSANNQQKVYSSSKGQAPGQALPDPVARIIAESSSGWDKFCKSMKVKGNI